MNSLVIAAMTVITLYVLAMIIARWKYDGHGSFWDAVPESISSTVYLLPRKGQWLFTVVMWIIGFCLVIPLMEKVPDSTRFLAFLMVAGVLGVGTAPLVARERNTFHYVCAAVSGVTSQLLVALNQPCLLLVWSLYVGYTLLAKDDSKNFFWVQVLCMLTVFAYCLTP